MYLFEFAKSKLQMLLHISSRADPSEDAYINRDTPHLIRQKHSKNAANISVVLELEEVVRWQCTYANSLHRTLVFLRSGASTAL